MMGGRRATPLSLPLPEKVALAGLGTLGLCSVLLVSVCCSAFWLSFPVKVFGVGCQPFSLSWSMFPWVCRFLAVPSGISVSGFFFQGLLGDDPGNDRPQILLFSMGVTDLLSKTPFCRSLGC